MLSLSCPRPQEVGAQPPRSGRRLKVGELSDVVSGALLSMLAMPSTPKMKSVSSLQDSFWAALESPNLDHYNLHDCQVLGG